MVKFTRVGLPAWRCAGGLDIAGKEAAHQNVRFSASLNKRQQDSEEQQKRYTKHHLLAGGLHGIFFRFYKITGRVIVLQGHLLSRSMLMYIGHNKKSTAEHNAYYQSYNHAGCGVHFHTK